MLAFWARRVVLATLSAATLLAGAVACGGGDGQSPSGQLDDPGSPSTGAPAPASSSPVAPVVSTTGPPISTAVVPPPPPAVTYPTTDQEYADVFMAAWTAGDTSTENSLAQPNLMTHLQALIGSADHVWSRDQPCTSASGWSYCRYINQHWDLLLLKVSLPTLGQAHALYDYDGATMVNLMTYPSNAPDYVFKFITEWHNGEWRRVNVLSNDTVQNAAYAHAPTPDPSTDWVPCLGYDSEKGLSLIRINRNQSWMLQVQSSKLGGAGAVVGWVANTISC